MVTLKDHERIFELKTQINAQPFALCIENIFERAVASLITFKAYSVVFI